MVGFAVRSYFHSVLQSQREKHKTNKQTNKTAGLTAQDLGFSLFSALTSAVGFEISMQASFINSGADKVTTIIGSSLRNTNDCRGSYLGTAPTLTVTLRRLGVRCLIQKKTLLSNRLLGLLR